MKTILKVDDSASIRQMVRLMLAGPGYQVTAAADGAAWLRPAQAMPAQIVVKDLRMPVMDGMTFTRGIRKLPAYKGVPIVCRGKRRPGWTRAIRPPAKHGRI